MLKRCAGLTRSVSVRLNGPVRGLRADVRFQRPHQLINLSGPALHCAGLTNPASRQQCARLPEKLFPVLSCTLVSLRSSLVLGSHGTTSWRVILARV
jgi:hypothetical protein